MDQLNEATIAIHEANIQMAEDIKAYQESVFDAVVWKVQQYIDEIEDAKDEINDYYDDLLDDLEDEADARDRNAELIELENNLLTAREGARVYREGIGWVYEGDRKKEKEALQDI